MNILKIVEPNNKELPSSFANRLGIHYAKQASLQHKKESGQFFTPPAIAHLMASFSNWKNNNIKILDPGCGTAILTCALVEQIVNHHPKIEFIDLVAYETDAHLISFAQQTLVYLKKWLKEKGIKFQYILHIHDFILDNANAIKKDKGEFDIIISNPPYFKLSKDDKRTLSAKTLVSGQPNIYSIFMGVAAALLKQGGELIFITPRSFASGQYFKAFREYFFNQVELERIHLFNSRKEAFSKDAVLQETVIVKAIKSKSNEPNRVTISSSVGLKDIDKPSIKTFTADELIDLNSKEIILHLPTNEKEETILKLVSSWTNKLIDYNIQISTGPVVSFRALDFIQNHYQNGTVFLAPLFWLNNVKKMFLEWPIVAKDKGQYIKIEKGSRSILLPNKNYIL